MGEIKSHVYHDHEEGHSRSIQRLNFEKVTTTKEFLGKIEQRIVKNEKVKISTLLTSLMSISCRGRGKDKSKKRNTDKEAVNTIP